MRMPAHAVLPPQALSQSRQTHRGAAQQAVVQHSTAQHSTAQRSTLSLPARRCARRLRHRCTAQQVTAGHSTGPSNLLDVRACALAVDDVAVGQQLRGVERDPSKDQQADDACHPAEHGERVGERQHAGAAARVVCWRWVGGRDQLGVRACVCEVGVGVGVGVGGTASERRVLRPGQPCCKDGVGKRQGSCPCAPLLHKNLT